MSEKHILDVCCGSRMFHFDKANPIVFYCDIRSESHILCDGRDLEIKPDLIQDFTNMKTLKNESFWHVVFDPPHLFSAGDDSYMALKYGRLTQDWKEQLSAGFNECWRVLKINGTLVVKWNEDQIKVSEILGAFGRTPIYGHKSGKQQKTHWLVFFKTQ